MSKKIFFRADGNQEIGYGHIIRSLALADMLKDDFECVFVTRFLNEFLENEINKVCQKHIILSKQNDNHFEEFLNILKGDEIVVLDNYFFTTEYQKQIRIKNSTLVCIDDLGDNHFVSDLIINHIDITPYKRYSKEKHTKLILGIENALLRKDFFEENKSIKREKRLLVAFGGVDFNNLTYKYLNILINNEIDVKIDVIINKENEKYKEITNEVEKNSNITVYSSLSAKEVRNLMLKSKVAILPSSTMCIEALACGTNIVSGYYIGNQEYAYNYFLKNDFISGLENLNVIQEKRLIELVEINLKNPKTGNKIIDRINSSKGNYIRTFKSLSKC